MRIGLNKVLVLGAFICFSSGLIAVKPRVEELTVSLSPYLGGGDAGLSRSGVLITKDSDHTIWLQGKKVQLSAPEGYKLNDDLLVSPDSEYCACTGDLGGKVYFLQWNTRDLLAGKLVPAKPILLPADNQRKPGSLYSISKSGMFAYIRDGSVGDKEITYAISNGHLVRIPFLKRGEYFERPIKHFSELDPFLYGFITKGPTWQNGVQFLMGPDGKQRSLPKGCGWFVGTPDKLCSYECKPPATSYWNWNGKCYVNYKPHFPAYFLKNIEGGIPREVVGCGKVEIYVAAVKHQKFMQELVVHKNGHWSKPLYLKNITDYWIRPLGEKQDVCWISVRNYSPGNDFVYTSYLLDVASKEPRLINCDTWLKGLGILRPNEKVGRVLYAGPGTRLETGIYIFRLDNIKNRDKYRVVKVEWNQ